MERVVGKSVRRIFRSQPLSLLLLPELELKSKSGDLSMELRYRKRIGEGSLLVRDKSAAFFALLRVDRPILTMQSRFFCVIMGEGLAHRGHVVIDRGLKRRTTCWKEKKLVINLWNDKKSYLLILPELNFARTRWR